MSGLHNNIPGFDIEDRPANRTSTERSHTYRAKLGHREPRKFIAWDGEGIGRDYTMLAWHDGTEGGHIWNDNGLSTLECLEFIDSVAERNRTAIHVIFGGSYDFNHWLRDFSRPELQRIYKDRRFPSFNLKPGYSVKFSLMLHKWFYFKLPHRKRGIKVYDVVSFFQSSFVKACDDYLGDDWYQREQVVADKQRRGDFKLSEREQIIAYNEAELINLKRLMDTLRDHARKVDLVPEDWHGPATIAQKLLRNNGVERHMSREKPAHPQSNLPAAVEDAARHAYSGGRAEMLKWGDVHGYRNTGALVDGKLTTAVWEYDINSAYPAAMRELPSLVGGRWEHSHSDPNVQAFALYRVRWNLPGMRPTQIGVPAPGSNEVAMPFAWRNPQGAIFYPANGENWVWSPEVNAVRKDPMVDMQILEAWVYHPPKEHGKVIRPFGFIQDTYDHRLALKAAGDGGQYAIKLGLNSMYGKLAQQSGAREQDGEWSIPGYHELLWAGYVTSWCRAKVRAAALQKPHAVVAFATDALFMSEPLDLPLSKKLGEWELTEFQEFCNIQAGFYFGVSGGVEIVKTRGVERHPRCRVDCTERHEHDYRTVPEKIRAGWDDREVELHKRGFVGMGVALQQGMEKWRAWEEKPRKVSIGKTYKRNFPDLHPIFQQPMFYGGFHESIATWLGEDWKRDDGSFMSHPFRIEWANAAETQEMDLMVLARESSSGQWSPNEMEWSDYVDEE